MSSTGHNIFGGGGTSLTIGGKLTNSSTNGNGVYGRQHRHHFGRHFDGERDGRALQWHRRDQHRGQRVRPGDPERRQCGGGVRHEGGGDRDGLPRKRRALGIQDRLRSRRSMASCGSTARSARVADAGATTSNSALTGLTSVAGNFYLENGAKVATTGNLSVIGNGQVGARRAQHRRRRRDQPDDRREADQQQHQRQRRLDVGNTGITSADTLTVNGTGGLSNGTTSEINIEGSASVQATLNVANAAAGFGSGKGWRPGRSSSKTTRSWNSRPARSRRSMASWGSTARARTSPTRAPRQQQRADRPHQRHRQFLSGERRQGRADRQFEHHRRRDIVSLDGPDSSSAAAGAQPDDRREADQQQHQRQWHSTSATPASRRPTH